MCSRDVTAWIAEEVWQAMLAEVERAFPNETGGVLMGYWTVSGTDVVVTHMVGPGPLAMHRRTSFVPDADYHEQEIARLYNAANRQSTYLGDWHSHPNAAAYLSPQDKRTLRRIAEHPDARAPRPVMAIMAGATPWRVGMWALTRRLVFGSLHIRQIHALRVVVF